MDGRTVKLRGDKRLRRGEEKVGVVWNKNAVLKEIVWHDENFRGT